eukprot:4552700-Pyramimonas_sp.AAC.1
MSLASSLASFLNASMPIMRRPQLITPALKGVPRGPVKNMRAPTRLKKKTSIIIEGGAARAGEEHAGAHAAEKKGGRTAAD